MAGDARLLLEAKETFWAKADIRSGGSIRAFLTLLRLSAMNHASKLNAIFGGRSPDEFGMERTRSILPAPFRSRPFLPAISSVVFDSVPALVVEP